MKDVINIFDTFSKNIYMLCSQKIDFKNTEYKKYKYPTNDWK